MKICLVPTMFPKYKGDYYGSFVFDEAKLLVKKGFEVHVVTQHNPHTKYNEIIDGIHIHRFKWLEPKQFKALVHFKGLKDNLRFITYLISLFFKVIRIIRKHDIEIIHAHSTIPTGFIGVIVGKIMGKPVFITTHGMDVNNFIETSFLKQLMLFSLKSCDKIICVSEDLANTIADLGIDSKIVVLRNAVDTNKFKPLKNMEIRQKYGIKKNSILILFVGYLDVFKGIFELIDAFFEVNKENNDLKVMIIGEGPQESKIKDKVSKLKLDTSIIFTGKISSEDIPQYYQAADIFVLPSYTEGTPLAVIEAMACGLPIIASNVGGISEIVISNENGFIISPKNIKELSSKLRVLVKNQSLRSKFSNKSLKIINSEFNIDKKVEKLIDLYKNI